MDALLILIETFAWSLLSFMMLASIMCLVMCYVDKENGA